MLKKFKFEKFRENINSPSECLISLVDKRKRKGRGISAGQGKTAGRGTKGSGARKSPQKKKLSEGGQTKVSMRLPKVGFSHKKKDIFLIINVEWLENNDEILNGQTVDFSSSKKKVKLLGNGELKKTLTIKVHEFSLNAKKKIESLNGGKIIKIIKNLS